jgi:hypothetical protein
MTEAEALLGALATIVAEVRLMLVTATLNESSIEVATTFGIDV